MAEDEDADDAAILMGYYQQFEPAFATPTKIHKIIRTYRKKQELGQPLGSWKERMYAAFLQQRGHDPRTHWKELSPRRMAVAKSKLQQVDLD
jgi:hypothetical protein